MKTFEDENYYQVLQIPANASAEEIKHAYRNMLSIYEEDSVVTYSLFSDEQRQVLLQVIETAFDTLMNEDKRAAYNQMLIDTGQMDAARFSQQAQRQLAAYSDTTSTSKEKNLSRWVQKKMNEPTIRQLIFDIKSKPILSGSDLKELRKAYGIEIQEIYAITKISSDTMNKIESNRYQELPATVYLKQFLKAYAEILHLDVEHVVQGYLKCMAEGEG